MFYFDPRYMLFMAPAFLLMLVVHAPRLVALGAQDVQPARGQHLLALGLALLGELLEGLLVLVRLLLRIGDPLGQHLGVAPQHDVVV